MIAHRRNTRPRGLLAAVAAGAGVVAIAVASCTSDPAHADADPDALAGRLADDGSAVTEAIAGRSGADVQQRLVYDATLEESCGDEGIRRVWRTDLLLTAPAGDASDAQHVNREFDALYTSALAELSDRGYQSVVWNDDDADGPDWSVFRSEAGDEPPLEIRVTLQVAPVQPESGFAAQVDVIGTTPCLDG